MSTWGDVASAVSKFAPILGNAVPGVGTVVGAGVGLAASVIAKALGTDPSPDSIMAALAADPDAIVKLKQAEMDHEKDLASIAAQREQTNLAYQQSVYVAEAADRDSARQLAAKQPRDFMRPLLALAVVCLTGYIVYVVMSGKAGGWNETVIALVSTVMGYIISELKSVYGFYFGMTKDAQVQNAAITSFATAPGTVTAPVDDAVTVQAPTTSGQTVTVQPGPQAGGAAMFRGS
ncbi:MULTISPECIES: hypothetical protein [unclassified Caballeronia]|uniref:hypothetical protein n=1 Tax=unclassified Caballeronia TaxID=2646786 RepID=UPI00285578ED|nr:MULTISPECIES: hypothetical protein [unclassified Caballeronia]MDR5772070.1 hypothetical protein [Caballeronia sp. LZ002]MDR5847504.1 hypothetical protein [Caballeronia sp. LZ003]